MSPSRSGPAVLAEARSVTRAFGAHVAVDDVTLQVEQGAIVGLLGANGAGKTTLIRMLLGLLRPTDGRVAVFGATPSRSARRRLGYVPQGLGLYRDLTVDENTQFVAHAFGVPAPELPPELEAVRDRLVGEIGLGRQRRLAFVTALAHRPELVVLDEPTSGVDPLARARLWDLIHAEAERGAAVLVTTHYMQEAQQCDRLSIMASGRVVAEGTVASIIGDATAVLVRSERWQDAFNALSEADQPVTLDGRRTRVAGGDPDTVTEVLRSAGVVAEVEPAPATLEEIMVTVSREP